MSCPTPIRIKGRSKMSGLSLDVPCGRCGNCLEQRRSYWTFRMHEELRNHDSAAFITLTYTEPPLSKQNEPTLEKTALQNFIKRLRHHLGGRKIRYYAIGEYGTKTQRPHYHAIIFGLDRLEINYVREAWTLGQSMATPVNDARIHYLTKYHLNFTPKSERPSIRESEFALMSRNPGIGFSYIARTKKYHQKTENQFVMLNGFKQPLPRYYFDKIWEDPFTRERIANEKKERSQETLNQQYAKLQALGYRKPDLEHFDREIEKGVKYKRKKDDGRNL